jgi:hypothetical protein
MNLITQAALMKMRSASRLKPLLQESTALHADQNLIRPINISLNITQSPANE